MIIADFRHIQFKKKSDHNSAGLNVPLCCFVENALSHNYPNVTNVLRGGWMIWTNMLFVFWNVKTWDRLLKLGIVVCVCTVLRGLHIKWSARALWFILWDSMTSTSFVFTELADTMKYGGEFLYNLVFSEWRHCVSQNEVWGRGCYITLFSPSDVTAFHRIPLSNVSTLHPLTLKALNYSCINHGD